MIEVEDAEEKRVQRTVKLEGLKNGLVALKLYSPKRESAAAE